MAEFVKNNPNKKSKKNNNNGNYRTAKQREYGSKKESRITPPDNCGELIEYKMPQEMADQLVKGKKGDPQEILCNYVNTVRGLKGYCVKVIPY